MATQVSSLVAKLETEVYIKASAREFYHMFVGRPYLASDVSPGIVQRCDLLDGEWGTVDSVTLWNYVYDQKEKAAKVIIEAEDSAKNLIKFRVIEGNLMEDFKNLACTLQVTPNIKGSGSIVLWKLEYEKISEEVPHPETLLKLAVLLFKEIDKQLLSKQ